MALTPNQEEAWRRITDAENTDGPGMKTVTVDPDDATRNPYLRGLIIKYRDKLQLELNGLPAKQTQLQNQIAVLNGMLPLYP